MTAFDEPASSAESMRRYYIHVEVMYWSILAALVVALITGWL